MSSLSVADSKRSSNQVVSPLERTSALLPNDCAFAVDQLDDDRAAILLCVHGVASVSDEAEKG